VHQPESPLEPDHVGVHVELNGSLLLSAYVTLHPKDFFNTAAPAIFTRAFPSASAKWLPGLACIASSCHPHYGGAAVRCPRKRAKTGYH